MRIRMLEMSEAGWVTRLIDRVMRRQTGGDGPTAAAIYGHHPGVLLSFALFGAGYQRWNALPARLKRLVHLRAALRVGCPS